MLNIWCWSHIQVDFLPFPTLLWTPELTLGSLVLWLLVGFGWGISRRPIGGRRKKSGYYHCDFLYILGLSVPLTAIALWVALIHPVLSVSPGSLIPSLLYPFRPRDGMVILCHLPWDSVLSHVVSVYALHNSGKNPSIKFTVFPIWVCLLFPAETLTDTGQCNEVCFINSLIRHWVLIWTGGNIFLEMYRLWYWH